jgi:hypothetical protein
MLCQPAIPHIVVSSRGTYVAAGEVTTLEHELGDDAVEVGALVVEGLAGLAGALLTSAESAEVLGRLSMIVSDCSVSSRKACS